MRRGAWAWFHDVWTCGVKVLEYRMISWLKFKLNCSWKYQRNWNMALVLLERSWWAGFNGMQLVRFGFRMWEILIFKVISAAENSNKFPKNQVLEGKISWECGNIWANGTDHTSVYFWVEILTPVMTRGGWDWPGSQLQPIPPGPTKFIRCNYWNWNVTRYIWSGRKIKP